MKIWPNMKLCQKSLIHVLKVCFYLPLFCPNTPFLSIFSHFYPIGHICRCHIWRHVAVMCRATFHKLMKLKPCQTGIRFNIAQIHLQNLWKSYLIIMTRTRTINWNVLVGGRLQLGLRFWFPPRPKEEVLFNVFEPKLVERILLP